MSSVNVVFFNLFFLFLFIMEKVLEELLFDVKWLFCSVLGWKNYCRK